LLGLRRKAQDASRISCKVADGRIELRERYLHARALEYGWISRIANSGHDFFRLLNRNVRSIPILRFLRHQAGDSLPCSQLAIKKHAEHRETHFEARRTSEDTPDFVVRRRIQVALA